MWRAIICCGFIAVGAAAFAQSSSPLKKLDSADLARAWEAVGRLDMGTHGMCTGALIEPDVVLTAAHCVFDARGTNVQR